MTEPSLDQRLSQCLAALYEQVTTLELIFEGNDLTPLCNKVCGISYSQMGISDKVKFAELILSIRRKP